jgi:hypothetical protein
MSRRTTAAGRALRLLAVPLLLGGLALHLWLGTRLGLAVAAAGLAAHAAGSLLGRHWLRHRTPPPDPRLPGH